MTRTLSERGERMLAMLPPFYWNINLVQAVIDADATELDRIDAAIQQTVLNHFPSQADSDGLRKFEALLSLPIEPPALTLEQRRATVEAYYRLLRRATEGTAWEQRMSDALGTVVWRYAMNDPKGWKGFAWERWASLFGSPWFFMSGVRQSYAIEEDGWLSKSDNSQTIALFEQERHVDQMVMRHFKIGAATDDVGVVVKENAAGHVLVKWDSGNLRIYTFEGSYVLRDTVARALTIGKDYWLVGRIENNEVRSQIWDHNPREFDATPLVDRPYTLVGGQATNFGTGVFGYPGIRDAETHAGTRTKSILFAEVGLDDIPANTLRVTIPYASSGSQAAVIEALIRKITPANTDIQVFYEEGFLLGISLLGEEGLS